MKPLKPLKRVEYGQPTSADQYNDLVDNIESLRGVVYAIAILEGILSVIVFLLMVGVI